MPGASRGLPGTSWAGQDGPKSPQERPKSRQNSPVLPAIWRPTAPQELPRGLQEVIWAPSGLDYRPCGGRLAKPRPLNVHPSGEHLPLLLGLSTARPPKRKRLENAKITTPPKRPSKQSLAPKPLANKGARRCGRSHSQYTHTLSQKTMDTISCKLQCSSLLKW